MDCSSIRLACARSSNISIGIICSSRSCGIAKGSLVFLVYSEVLSGVGAGTLFFAQRYFNVRMMYVRAEVRVRNRSLVRST